uniref:VWFA domain-containing protein n=1 Tax=Panagrolaimus superbus TaxID=310955 RepID=A0A914YXN3_9BILA
MPIPQQPTVLPFLQETDPRTNAIGSLCSANASNAWLDIVLAIDISDAMNARDLQEFSGEIASLLSQFNINQWGDHTSRVAIVTYASNVVVRYFLNDVTSLTALNHQLLLLRSYANSSDNGVNVQKALQVSYNLLKNQSSNRIPVIILVGAAYNNIGFNGAEQIASVIKDNGIKLLQLVLMRLMAFFQQNLID